jgi:hypothetical protein
MSEQLAQAMTRLEDVERLLFRGLSIEELKQYAQKLKAHEQLLEKVLRQREKQWEKNQQRKVQRLQQLLGVSEERAQQIVRERFEF